MSHTRTSPASRIGMTRTRVVAAGEPGCGLVVRHKQQRSRVNQIPNARNQEQDAQYLGYKARLINQIAQREDMHNQEGDT